MNTRFALFIVRCITALLKIAKHAISKIWWCDIWKFHDWTTPLIEKQMPPLQAGASDFEVKLYMYHGFKMYCKRCGHESEISKDFRIRIMLTNLK